jgi:hypothetical protein
MALRICPTCLTVADFLPDHNDDACIVCRAEGEHYRTLAAWEFDRCRASWSAHPAPEVVQMAHAALDKAERRLALDFQRHALCNGLIPDLTRCKFAITIYPS